MTTFKYKPNKIKFRDEITTLDSTHRSLAAKFQNNREDLDKKKSQRKSLIKELKDIDNSSEFNISDIKRKSKIKKEINELTELIEDIENNTSEINYYKNAGDFIIDYYEEEKQHNTSHSGEDETITEKIVIKEEIDHLDKLNDLSKLKRKPKKNTKKRVRTVRSNQKSIMDFFDEESNETKKTNTDSEEKQKKISNHNVKNKATIFEQYKRLVDNNCPHGNRIRNISFCKKCGIDKTLLQSEGIYVCTECGEFESIIIESDIPNYKDQMQEKPAYYRMRRTGGYGTVRFLILCILL